MKDMKPQVINPLKGKTEYGWHFEQEIFHQDGIARAVKSGGGSGNIPKVIVYETEDYTDRHDMEERGQRLGLP